jgi:hypothetical protein
MSGLAKVAPQRPIIHTSPLIGGAMPRPTASRAGRVPGRAGVGARGSHGLNSCEYFRMKPDALKHPDNLR